MADNQEATDIYGQVHPVETKELVASKLSEFDAQLSKIRANDAILQAQEKCSELLTDAFKLQFLRCELFDIEVCMYSGWSSV